MKQVVVIYYRDDWHKTVPFVSESTKRSFEDWHVRGLKKDVELYRASIKWYDSEKKVFLKSWAFRDGVWKRVTKPVKPDMIYDKTGGKRDIELFDWKMRISTHTKIFNNPLFRTFLDNKLSQYIAFGEFMPFSYMATDKKELLSRLGEVKSRKIVVKPLHGSGGNGIVIADKKVIGRKKMQFPVLAQEFVVSQKGIPGFSKKNEVSDLRMVFMNHKIVFALSRIAKKGSLFTNFHQGASAIIVPRKAIPESALGISNKIVKKLKAFPEAHYSLDFIFTNSGKPVLVEINTTPGVDLLHIVGDEKLKDRNFSEFISLVCK